MKLIKYDNYRLNEEEQSPVDIIDEWMETYLDAQGLDKSKRQYQPDAGVSLQTVLRKHGYQIVKKA